MAEQVASAYLNVVPKVDDGLASDAGKKVASAITQHGEPAGAGFATSMLGKMGPMLAAGAVVAGAAAAKGAVDGLMDIGKTFDSMTDTIVVGTGASGAALDALVESAKSIATTVPTSFENAGDVVQNLNTRMGLVGDQLEDVGNRVIAAGQMLGQEVNLDSLTGAFNAFGVANEDAASKMDYLFNVGQATGIGFNELAGIIEKNAPALQGLGFSFEESANMAGLLDKAGMDASGTMAKMGKALVELSEPGQSAAEAYQGVISSIEGYIAAGDSAAAIEVASKIFGTKGAAQFVGAVESGAVSLEELQNAALGAGDGIMGTMEKTMDWPEKWEILKNKATEALEPIGGALMDGANKAMDKFSEALDNIDPSFFDSLATGVADFIENGADLLVQGIEWFIDNKDDIFEGMQGAMSGITGTMTVLGSLAEVIGDVVGIAAESFGFFVSLVMGDMDGASEHVKNAGNIIGEILGFPNLGSTVQGVFDAVRGFIEDPVGTARNFVQNMVEDIKGFFNFQWSLPDLQLPHIVVGGYIDVPVLGMIPDPSQIYVEWYATGGIFNGASVIGVGEAGAEAVLPIEKLVPLMADAMKQAFSSHESGNMASALADEVASTAGRRSVAPMDGRADLLWAVYGRETGRDGREAAGWQRGGVDIHDCTFAVREEADVRRVAAELNSMISRQMAGGFA